MSRAQLKKAPGVEQLCLHFNAEARQVVRDFGDRFDGFVFGSKNHEIYVSRQLNGGVIGDLGQEILQMQQRFMSMYDVAGTFKNFEVEACGRLQRIGSVMVNLESDQRSYVSNKFPLEMELTAAFDHEVGHMLVPGGHQEDLSSHYQECAAEAYALIRHVQRYGTGTDIFEVSHVYAMSQLLEGSAHYYVAGVIDKVLSLSRSVDLSALTPQQTVTLAGSIAENYHYSNKRLNHLMTAFAPGRKLYTADKIDAAAIFHAVFDGMDSSEAACRAGAYFIYHHINNVSTLAKDDPRLNSRLQRLQQELDNGFMLDAARAIDRDRARSGLSPFFQKWMRNG